MTDPDLLLSICKHPNVFCAGIKTTRDLIIFLCGVCCSPEHLHGDDLSGFSAYLNRRLKKQPSIMKWPSVLFEEFGNKPLAEGCDALAALLREWSALRPAERTDIG